MAKLLEKTLILQLSKVVKNSDSAELELPEGFVSSLEEVVEQLFVESDIPVVVEVVEYPVSDEGEE